MQVSVVIPTYNEEKYIGKVLKSLNNQTVNPGEIVVIDNNCKDKTTAIAKKLGAKVIKETKQGLIYARNRGFDSAQYEIIARCDADTEVQNNWIEKIIDNFSKGNIDALSGPVIYYDSFLRIFSVYPSDIYLKIIKILTKGKNHLLGPNMILTKKAWIKVKKLVHLDDKIVHEDIDLSLNLLKIGAKINYDRSLSVKTSSRRIVKNPFSFFFEYPLRLLKTFWVNRN
jgi:glycosyltransferase involved in cell wall biosynthesis